MKKALKILFIWSLCFVVSACEDNSSVIPDYEVNLRLDLQTMGGEYSALLNSFGQNVAITERRHETDRIGFGGILLCTTSTGVYCAFDMACPHEVNREIRVYPNGIGQAVCEECGSVYDILTDEYARPISGPARQGLKKYRALLSNNSILYVTR